jgi:hypothetical protein
MSEVYFCRFTDFHGTALTAQGLAFPEPLPVADIQFQDICFVPGQHNLGAWKVDLFNVQDPTHRYLQIFYNAIDYEQIIEIYNNNSLLGDPVYKGVVTRPASGDLSHQTVEGAGYL